jgi:hypothetical protein
MNKQKAKILSLEIWTYLKKHPTIDTKCDLPTKLLKKVENLPAYCPLCRVFAKYQSCSENCPLYDCVNPASNNLYSLWRDANTPEERRKYAAKIISRLQAWQPEEGK